MAIFFTLLFVLTAYLAPETLFGSLAAYHIEVAIAAVALLCSIPSIPDSGMARMPQTYGMLGLCIAVPLSIIIGASWLGGAPAALLEFIPNSIVFFFILWNFKTKRHLQILIALLFFCALFIIAHGYLDMRAENRNSLYLIQMFSSPGVFFFRIRGLSLLNDPNDLAQFLIGLIPFMFLFWAKGNAVRNLFFVYLPVSLLCFGLYLTHSRGGLLAFLLCCVIVGRRRFGTVAAVVVGGLLFVGLMAAGFTGGRDVTAGSDRTAAWSQGLTLLRTHPLFGVGFGRFGDHYEITAHNSVVVTAAELGFPGLVAWLLLILPTVRDALVGSQSFEKRSEADSQSRKRGAVFRLPQSGGAATWPSQSPNAFERAAGQRVLPWHAALPAGDRPPMPERGTRGRDEIAMPSVRDSFSDAQGAIVDRDPLMDEEIRRMSGLMVISLAGYLAAGWFLSRSYAMPVFVEVGVASVVYKISQNHGLAPPSWSLPRALKLSLFTACALLIIVYIWVRLNHFAH